MDKLILVTGGTGFIGSHTSVALLQRGYKLIIIDSLINSSSKVINNILFLSRKENENYEKNLKFIKADLRDENALNNIFKRFNNANQKIEAVIHFAGLKSVIESVKDPIKYWDFNVKGSINLLNIMRHYECYKLVFSSSATIYGYKSNNQLIKENDKISPINPYGETKEAIEKIIKNLSEVQDSKWNVVVLRYFNPIGAHPSGLIGDNPLELANNIIPIINKVASCKINELEIYGNDWRTIDGTGVRDYIHVMDLAEGHIAALELILKSKNNSIQINLGTGQGTSVLELVNCFAKSNNVNLPYKFSSRREGDTPYSVADNSLAKLKLNWEPKRDLREMCIDSWNSYLKNSNY